MTHENTRWEQLAVDIVGVIGLVMSGLGVYWIHSPTWAFLGAFLVLVSLLDAGSKKSYTS
jgi:apolipoprotein N-acyltransferase